MVAGKIGSAVQMVIDKIESTVQKLTNSYRRVIDNKWPTISEDKRREIASYLKYKEKIIESYLGRIDKENIDKLLDSIDKFTYYKGSSIEPSTVSDYVGRLENLDKIMKDVNRGHFSSLPKYNNVIKPNNNYIEIAFSIEGKPEEHKKTLIEILKIIGNIGARGYPISYYNNGIADSPIQYYMEPSKGQTEIRFLIDKSIPSNIVGYLLYELNNIRGKESIIPPSGKQYYIINNELGIINNRIGIDSDPSSDSYIASALQDYHFLYKFF